MKNVYLVVNVTLAGDEVLAAFAEAASAEKYAEEVRGRNAVEFDADADAFVAVYTMEVN